MNILQLPLHDVKPYGRNPRKNDKAAQALGLPVAPGSFSAPSNIPPQKNRPSLLPKAGFSLCNHEL
jgi:hypothetical protein